MNRKLSVAIIGAGKIAGDYDAFKNPGERGIYTHAGAYKKDGRFILQTVFDKDRKKAEKFKKEWGVKNTASGIKDIILTYHDVVSVCTPDPTHFKIISELIKNRSCRTIFAEKPLAFKKTEIKKIEQLSNKNRVNVVVNFQRRFDPVHAGLKGTLNKDLNRILAVNAYYVKGIGHVGTTMIDTLLFLFGVPEKVYAYNRVYNKEAVEYSYEFIMFYRGFNITIKTADNLKRGYCYHIFEIDVLLTNRRLVINDNSRQLEVKALTNYAYGGVRVLNDKISRKETTKYDISMLNEVNYIYAITKGTMRHTVNLPAASLTNKTIMDKVLYSYNKKRTVKIKE